MGFPSGVASLEREALDPYQSFITGGAAVATLEGGFSMPGNRELTPSASCPNWPNIRDLLTSADDLCSGNARGEPGFELGEPSAIDMRSIGISNKNFSRSAPRIPAPVSGARLGPTVGDLEATQKSAPAPTRNELQTCS